MWPQPFRSSPTALLISRPFATRATFPCPSNKPCHPEPLPALHNGAQTVAPRRLTPCPHSTTLFGRLTSFKIQLAATSLGSPSLPLSLGEGLMALLSLLLPADSSLRRITLSFQAGVSWKKGQLWSLSAFRVIGSDLGQLEPSCYKQPGGHEECYYCLRFVKWKNVGHANIIVSWLLCLIHSAVIVLEGRNHLTKQCMAGLWGYCASVRWWNEEELCGTRHTCSEPSRTGVIIGQV